MEATEATDIPMVDMGATERGRLKLAMGSLALEATPALTTEAPTVDADMANRACIVKNGGILSASNLGYKFGSFGINLCYGLFLEMQNLSGLH